ncbi:LysR substrate-binding domain-containing protein [Scandinavium sp. H11S7]|uniref:LysR substrate-binding domain-containing protein n=1 Tax=Scandinavium hiltneri TaxID=2926519 RepID=A0ABT2E5E9_9ENTR|nr:LysR substrate-binding domain-containing protein [Scandinavium hiltneri]MCS2163111.1 LysR substrate-binding domain-containing protein [Scandinavium hiltneri]
MLEQQSTLALLQSFEVAARHMSFTLAAKELNLTQGAMSHRIRLLENYLGFRLFIRMTRKLLLTEEGERLLATLSLSLRAIGDEIEDIRSQSLRGTLHIGVAPTFAQNWLMKRLPEFQTLWPGINLTIKVRAGVMEFHDERVDLAIYYGASRYADLHQERLFDEQLIPVCSPEYARRKGVTQMCDLQEGCYIHASESTDSQQSFSEWRIWCEYHGLDIPYRKQHYSFNHYQMAIQAAESGIGVLMGRKLLIQPLLDSGRLVALSELTIASGMGYDLIYPKENSDRIRFKAFIEFLRQQISATSSSAGTTLAQ